MPVADSLFCRDHPLCVVCPAPVAWSNREARNEKQERRAPLRTDERAASIQLVIRPGNSSGEGPTDADETQL